jgi:hypothetical protein
MTKKQKKTLAEQIESLKPKLGPELERLSELARPPTVPAPWLVANWIARAGGNEFEALLIADKAAKAASDAR